MTIANSTVEPCRFTTAGILTNDQLTFFRGVDDLAQIVGFDVTDEVVRQKIFDLIGTGQFDFVGEDGQASFLL